MCRVVRQRLCTCETGIRFHICLSESFSPDGSHATPKACRSMIAPTPLAGASSPDSFYSICRSLTRLDGLESDYTELYLGLRLRACPGLSRFTLGKGSISVCLGSSAAGGPASESGTSFTAHASAHDPKVTFFCCERAMGPRRVFISFESAGSVFSSAIRFGSFNCNAARISILKHTCSASIGRMDTRTGYRAR